MAITNRNFLLVSPGQGCGPQRVIRDLDVVRTLTPFFPQRVRARECRPGQCRPFILPGKPATVVVVPRLAVWNLFQFQLEINLDNRSIAPDAISLRESRQASFVLLIDNVAAGPDLAQ